PLTLPVGLASELVVTGGVSPFGYLGETVAPVAGTGAFFSAGGVGATFGLEVGAAATLDAEYAAWAVREATGVAVARGAAFAIGAGVGVVMTGAYPGVRPPS